MAGKTERSNNAAGNTLAILMAVLIALMGLTGAVAGTYALFSDSATVNNHIQAGSLEVGLVRTEYKTHVLGDDGLMKDNTNTKRVDLAKDGSQLFDLVKVVPTTTCTATLEVSNKGSVAFDYGVRILFDGSALDAKSTALAKQLQITIKVGDEVKGEFKLSQSADKDVALGMLLAKGVQNFTVTVEFVNTEDTINNTAQVGNVEFDLQVYAVQHVETQNA